VISVLEAQRLIQKNTPIPQAQCVGLLESLGSVLARDVVSPVNLPLADNSAMDGFVLSSKDTENARLEKAIPLKIVGCLQAGEAPRRNLRSGTCLRIMTGAWIPRGADTVLAKEDAVIEGEYLVLRHPVVPGQHVRCRGEEIKKGKKVLFKDTPLHVGSLAFLASMGIKKLHVFRKPRVSVIATGRELISPGRKLSVGKIYDSNTTLMSACLKEMNLSPIELLKVSDDPQKIKRAIQKTLKKTDILILTGGVSVGDYDFVKAMLKACGVRSIFWKVNQKPGKPLLFGKKDQTLIFGLPGNPASVHLCFYEYVYPAIRRFMGHKEMYLAREKARLLKAIQKPSDKWRFLKGAVSYDDQTPVADTLSHQGSHMLSSLCSTNAFLVVPPHRQMKQGDWIDCHLLPSRQVLEVQEA